MLMLNKHCQRLCCKRDYYTLRKNHYYAASGGYGNPQKAIEMGFERDIPLEFMTLVEFKDKDQPYYFRTNDQLPLSYVTGKKHPYIWRYFYKPNELRIKKLKKIEKNC